MSKLYQTLRVLLQNNMKLIKEYMKPCKKGAYSPKKKIIYYELSRLGKIKPHCVSHVCEEFWSNVC